KHAAPAPPAPQAQNGQAIADERNKGQRGDDKKAEAAQNAPRGGDAAGGQSHDKEAKQDQAAQHAAEPPQSAEAVGQPGAMPVLPPIVSLPHPPIVAPSQAPALAAPIV